MTLLKNTPLVCLDCEFTGLDFEKDRIIEIGAIRFTLEEELDSYEALINPEMVIPDESIKIHGITNAMVKDQPLIKEILEPFFAFIGRDTIVGHAVGLDIDMLQREAKRVDIPCNLKARPYIDTLRLARLYGDSPNNSLQTLGEHFNITGDGAHRAMNDVRMNIAVFKQLVSKFKTFEEVMKVLSKPIKMKYMPLGQHKGRLFKEIPLAYLQWAANADFDQDLLFTLRSELKRRKGGGGFSQVTNPFSEL